MDAMLVAEAVSNVTGLIPVIDDLITVATKIIQFGLTTFPINVGVVVGLTWSVTKFIKSVKPAAKG